MTAEIGFHPAARAEAVAASVYLESERPGYGARFAMEFEELCGRLARHPKSGTPLPGYPRELDVRSYAMTTFRYSLIVAIIEGDPMVFAIAHQHRKPGYWRDRLK
jgi:plasmid stabilization system protein ParE